MERLRHNDFQKLYRAISELNSDTDPASLPRRTITAVQTVVDCDFITFDSFGDNEVYLDSQWNSDSSILTEKLLSEFARLFNAAPHEHPLSHLLTSPPFQIQKFSDFVTKRDFEKTALYNDFFRLVDLHHQIAFLIATDTGARTTCAVNRGRRDFTETERTLLSLLAPQLAASIKTAIELNKLYYRQALFESALSMSTRALVTVTRSGHITYASRFGEELIAKYFGVRELVKSVPLQLSDWVASVLDRRMTNAADIEPLICRSGDSQLRVDAIAGDHPEEVSLLMCEVAESRPHSLRSLGLTHRESEILFWVAKGKADDVIALLCNISTRTVNKHLEHIYRKLGVGSRLSAIQLINEFLSQSQKSE